MAVHGEGGVRNPSTEGKKVPPLRWRGLLGSAVRSREWGGSRRELI